MGKIQTSTLTNQNISTALLVGTYTATTERSALMCAVLVDQIAGNGLYTVYATRQLAGAGAAYEYQSRATVLVESGVTSIVFPSIIVNVSNTDVVKVYLVGLAGDTTTPDIICEFWDALPTVALAVAETDAATVSSGELSITSYTQFSQSITSTSTTAVDTATKVWLAIKDRKSETDAQSLVFIEKAGGLTVLAKDTYSTIANGTLAVTGSSGAWSIALTLKAAASALLHDYYGGGKYAEVKALIGGEVIVLWSGEAVIHQGVIRTTS